MLGPTGLTAAIVRKPLPSQAGLADWRGDEMRCDAMRIEAMALAQQDYPVCVGSLGETMPTVQ